MTVELPFAEKARLLVVTVNYRTADLVIESLRALETELQTVPRVRVTIVDNDSGDGSVEKIAAAIAVEGWEWATLMPSTVNGGFAYGNNCAIRPALKSSDSPDYFLLLNPDAQIQSGALKALIDFMDEHPAIGICGSSLEEANGKPWPYAFRFPSILGELENGLRLGIVSKLLKPWKVVQIMDQDQAQQIDWLPGASMVVRRDVFEAIGLMDEGYFLYYEETDFCLQARRAGWSCWYVPQSRVMHILGQSTGVTAKHQTPKRLPQYWFDSRRRFFLKNYGLLYTAIADANWILGFTLWRIRRAIQQKPDFDPPQMLGDAIRNSVFLKRGVPCQTLPSQEASISPTIADPQKESISV